MSVFSHKEFDNHEQVSFFHCPETGLKAIIAVHNTNLGPSLGGCRMWDYVDEAQALTDVLRLSRGMTYKAAITGLPLGGGKSVIIGDARKINSPALMRAMGRAVDSFHGRYITAEDVGTTVEDMQHISSQTKHVAGLADGSGDPSPVTAFGVYTGLKTAVRHGTGKNDLRGMSVAVQGLGNVGYNLCRLLAKDGAKLFVTDVRLDKIDAVVNEFGATAVALNDIYDTDADVFAPCALGAVLNDDTIKRLKVKVVAGAANNQLAEARHGDALKARKILYAPDYVINAGGVINVYHEYMSKTAGKAYDRDVVMAQAGRIDATVEAVFKYAEQKGIATSTAADDIALQRFCAKRDCKAA